MQNPLNFIQDVVSQKNFKEKSTRMVGLVGSNKGELEREKVLGGVVLGSKEE